MNRAVPKGDQVLAVPDPDACAFCFCTEDEPCPGPCAWMPGIPELCTACVCDASPFDIAALLWGRDVAHDLLQYVLRRQLTAPAAGVPHG